jgi:hypothetical protein
LLVAACLLCVFVTQRRIASLLCTHLVEIHSVSVARDVTRRVLCIYLCGMHIVACGFGIGASLRSSVGPVLYKNDGWAPAALLAHASCLACNHMGGCFFHLCLHMPTDISCQHLNAHAGMHMLWNMHCRRFRRRTHQLSLIHIVWHTESAVWCMSLLARHIQFGTKVWAAEVGSAALVKTQRNALLLCLSP